MATAQPDREQGDKPFGPEGLGYENDWRGWLIVFSAFDLIGCIYQFGQTPKVCRNHYTLTLGEFNLFVRVVAPDMVDSARIKSPLKDLWHVFL